MECKELTLTNDEFKKIRLIVYKTTGINLIDSKRALVISRLFKRLKALNINSFNAYISYLETNPDEISTFINQITTNLTKFYREKNQFDVFRKTIFPAILENKKNKNEKTIRIWSAGCSTGEEVYTILFEVAAALHENIPPNLDMKILGSDIDTNVLKKARSAQFSTEEIKPLDSKTIDTFFDPVSESTFIIKKRWMQYILFKRINLVYDPIAFKYKTDVIFCRNVVIYFDKETKKTVYEKFHSLLNDPGFLFSGHSENLFKYKNLFTFVEKSIYKKVV